MKKTTAQTNASLSARRGRRNTLLHTANLNQQQIFYTAMDVALQNGWMASQYPGLYASERRIVLTPWTEEAVECSAAQLAVQIRESCAGRWGVHTSIVLLEPQLFGREEFLLSVGQDKSVILSAAGQQLIK